MSIWINRAALFGGLLALAGCMEAGASLRQRPVLGGAVTVAAPSGYCIDPTGVLEGDGSALALIGRCANGTAVPAILTVTVGAEGSGQGIVEGQTALADFFASDQGRAALSRVGDATTVTVQETTVLGSAVLVAMTDSSPNPQAPGQTQSWRGVLPLEGRLVSLTVSGAGDTTLSSDQGRGLLMRFVAAMQRANGGGAV
jgi:hypothetical protein